MVLGYFDLPHKEDISIYHIRRVINKIIFKTKSFKHILIGLIIAIEKFYGTFT